jgi:hypothetical protein
LRSLISYICKLPATLKNDTTDNRTNNKTTDKNANTSQNKKSCNPTHKPTQIAAHFILPNRTQAHPPPDKWTGDNLRAIFTETGFKNLTLTK